MPETIKRYHPLGNRTLFMFIFKKSAMLLVLVPVLFLGLFALSYVPLEYVNLAANAIIGYFAVLLVIFVSAFFIGWLQYVRYWIFVDDKDLKIARGLIATEQIGVPYKHIQDVKIVRSLVDQIFGVSDIVITMAGSGQNDSESSRESEEENTIMLPSLSKEIALEIQDIMLKKAQVEQVHMVSNQRMV